MATIKEVIKRRFEENDLETAINIVEDFTCRFVLYLDNIGAEDNLNLNEALDVFKEYYNETTNISGNIRKIIEKHEKIQN